MKQVLVIGAGWAGLAAAVTLVQAGVQVTVCEAARTLGGRARALDVSLPDGQTATLDNGQHILIGAYSQTLQLMQTVSVDVKQALWRMPLTLRFPDGTGLQAPDWPGAKPAGLDAAVGIWRASGWSLADRSSLLRAALSWRLSGFVCDADWSVAQLCKTISPRVMHDMIEPLTVSALNTPTERASAQVFLRIMRDALFAPGQVRGMSSSNLLLPRADLGSLLPDAAQRWLQSNGASVQTGRRVESLSDLLSKREQKSLISYGPSADFPHEIGQTLLLATPPVETARLVRAAGVNADWCNTTDALQHEAITTVYAYAEQAHMAQPMLALHSDAEQPAQFVFDRGALTGHHGLLAFVVSASTGDAQSIEDRVIAQGRSQLKLPTLQAVKTIVDKRATFACTPGLKRPPMQIAERLFAAGDYIEGPYPSTLEGAVRSGIAAAQAIIQTS
jgi:hydroxysqualene dehydroxylase